MWSVFLAASVEQNEIERKKRRKWNLCKTIGEMQFWIQYEFDENENV